MNVLEDEVQRHLSVSSVAMGDVQKSETTDWDYCIIFYYVFLFAYMSIRLSDHSYVYLPVCPSLCLSICPFKIHLPICPSVRPSVSQSVSCLSVFHRK